MTSSSIPITDPRVEVVMRDTGMERLQAWRHVNQREHLKTLLSARPHRFVSTGSGASCR